MPSAPHLLWVPPLPPLFWTRMCVPLVSCPCPLSSVLKPVAFNASHKLTFNYENIVFPFV